MQDKGQGPRRVPRLRESALALLAPSRRSANREGTDSLHLSGSGLNRINRLLTSSATDRRLGDTVSRGGGGCLSASPLKSGSRPGGSRSFGSTWSAGGAYVQTIRPYDLPRSRGGSAPRDQPNRSHRFLDAHDPD